MLSTGMAMRIVADSNRPRVWVGSLPVVDVPVPPTFSADEIDAVVFDFAGVLTQSPTLLMRGFAEERGLALHDVMPLLLGPLDRDSDHPWHRIERGEISYAEFCAGIEAAFLEAGFSTFIVPPTQDQLMTALAPIPEMIATARAVRAAGFATAIVSNNIREWSRWREVVDADELVDVVIDSSDVGIRKPDPAIFELAATRLGATPTRCLMIDDFAWNLVGAQAIGMHTVHVTDPVADAARVRSLLELPER
jgi:putative hydrolase of the HAD superfamily